MGHSFLKSNVYLETKNNTPCFFFPEKIPLSYFLKVFLSNLKTNQDMNSTGDIYPSILPFTSSTGRVVQEPLRSEASPEASAIDVAVIWVSKAAKGSTQWTDTASLRQLKHYKFRKQLKPLTVSRFFWWTKNRPRFFFGFEICEVYIGSIMHLVTVANKGV